MKLLIIAGMVLLLVAILVPVLRTYSRNIAPLIGKLWKHKRLLMAVKRKVAGLGLSDADAGDAEPSAQVDIEGADELGARLKIFISNFQILSMVPAVLVRVLRTPQKQ